MVRHLHKELRRMGVPVTPFTPSKGADKFARMNACAPVFESGMVWRPDANFAEEVVEECAKFSMAIMMTWQIQ